MTRFQIKICGITNSVDLQLIQTAGADAVGLNMVASSPRCLSVEKAIELRAQAKTLDLVCMLVLMNPSAEELALAVEKVKPDVIQLHGKETPKLLQPFKGLQILKAVSWSDRPEEEELVRRWVEKPSLNYKLIGFLIDAYAPVAGGGTGRVARWDLLAPKPSCFGEFPIVLAGGLTSANVAEGIKATNCQAVDTASGVEQSPGLKDPQRLRSFVTAAREAFEAKRES